MPKQFDTFVLHEKVSVTIIYPILSHLRLPESEFLTLQLLLHCQLPHHVAEGDLGQVLLVKGSSLICRSHQATIICPGRVEVFLVRFGSCSTPDYSLLSPQREGRRGRLVSLPLVR